MASAVYQGSLTKEALDIQAFPNDIKESAEKLPVSLSLREKTWIYAIFLALPSSPDSVGT
jgi:hypothetical protein